MKLIFWNVRGCNKLFKQKELRVFLQNTMVDTCVLLETRVKVAKFKNTVFS